MKTLALIAVLGASFNPAHVSYFEQIDRGCMVNFTKEHKSYTSVYFYDGYKCTRVASEIEKEIGKPVTAKIHNGIVIDMGDLENDR